MDENLSALAPELGVEMVGGRDRFRTCDPLLAKQVLSQLSYTPTAETTFDSMVFAAVRKLRNIIFCPLGVDPYFETVFGAAPIRFSFAARSACSPHRTNEDASIHSP